jgi:hypothetical protein
MEETASKEGNSKASTGETETGILDSRPKLLRFHIPDPATLP